MSRSKFAASFYRVSRVDRARQRRRRFRAHSFGPDGHASSEVRLGEESIDLKRISVIWNRRSSEPAVDAKVSTEALRNYVGVEAQAYLRDTWNLFHGTWLPGPPSAIDRANFKASQLALAASLGFRLPPTLFTNDPDELIGFYHAHAGKIVSKLVSAALLTAMPEPRPFRFTQAVTRRDLAYADTVRYAPGVFQAYVDKAKELRITIVEDRVFAAEIHSQSASRTRVDWRRYDISHTPHYPHELPQRLEEQCLALVRAMGLRFGAIDMILTPDGEYVFLEINPNGQYLWIEEVTGLPISIALADALIAHETAWKGKARDA